MKIFTGILLMVIILSHGKLVGQIPLIPFDSVEVIQNGESMNNPWAGGMNCPQFSEIDLNEDGIKDLVTFERNFYGSVKTFLNLGTPGQANYLYAPEYQTRFPRLRNWMLLRDYNCDGKEDIFTSVPAGVAVYRNDTEPGGKLKFTLVTSLLQTIGLDGQTPLYVSPPDIPAIADIDLDGDLDVLSFEILGNTVEYHKNFSMENHGNCDQLEFELRNACWGYFSEEGSNNSVTLFDTCEINVPNPEKSALHAGSTLLALDLTGNGVKDLVIGDLTFNNLVELTNGGTVTSSGMIASDTIFPSNTVPVDLTVFPAAYSLDVNNDSKKDLIIAPNNPNTSENFNNIWYYQNIGTPDLPEFEFQQTGFLQNGMIDAGERSYATFFDENGDGLKDIILGNYGYFLPSGNYSSQLLLMRNTGTLSKPSFDLISDDYQDLSLFNLNGIYPAFGDLDDDGDEDMIVGDEDGLIHYFRNDAAPGEPANFILSQPNYKDIDVGQSAKPQIIDVNRDGLPDLLLGERSGTINYYKNIGTAENADFTAAPTSDFFGSIDVMPPCCTGYSTPFMTEDSTGNYILYVGSEQGKLFLFNEIENNLEGSFNVVDSLYLNAININISGTDLNGDNRLEMVMGQEAGGVGLLTYGIPEGLGIKQSMAARMDFQIVPNPSTGNIFIRLPDTPNEGEQSLKVSVINSMGQEIETYTTKSLNYNLGHLPRGFYFIQIQDENSFGIRKLILK